MKRDYSLSIVTPTYNRKHCLARSVEHSLALIASGYADELVIIDDASSDGTSDWIKQHYAAQISQGVLKFDALDVNQGVAGAKNRGAELASSDWVVLMDSDDWFVLANAARMNLVLSTHADYDIVFFRCQDQHHRQLVGPARAAADLTLSQLLNEGTPGECLPVFKRHSLLKYPYPVALRGSEGLTYLKVLKNGGTAHISDVILREYEEHAADRLSSKKGLRKRAGLLCRHNVHLLQYLPYARFRTVVGWLLRIGYYGFWAVLNKFKGG